MKLRRLTAEDREILGRVIRDYGRKRTMAIARYWLGIADLDIVDDDDVMPALRFFRDLFCDYRDKAVLKAIKKTPKAKHSWSRN
ncbi:MAG TPA: hypothetical protein VN688_00810 [Gemmataceae bacterium]|nr:hypothetical protein [Gemmataceae bacterium]